MATLVVGCGAKLIGSLRDQMPGEPVLVIEHPQVVKEFGLRDAISAFPNTIRLIEADYVHDCDAKALVNLLPPGAAVERVLPAIDETTAIGAAYLAQELKLPGPGVQAAEILHDKLRLRQVTSAAGLPNPRWREVGDLAQLVSAARGLAAGALVLKPSMRSGSQGVVLLDKGDDLVGAWRYTTTADGRFQFDPPLPTSYLLEERLRGAEVSVEALVVDGELVFTNITDKRVLCGRYPVEIGHVVPAVLDPAVRAELLDSVGRLVEAIGFRYGMLHCEWMLTCTGPALIECAGRLPGDRITDLIALAYDVPYVARYAELMASGGRGADMPDTAVRSAAVKFLTASGGIVARVTGVEDAAAAEGVRAAEVTVGAGDKVSAPRGSHDRIGHVMAIGSDPAQAWERAERAAALIQITVR